ncbi:amino acid ABC transporter substrate-binding protein [Piscinibacter gummiphilus]|uniref:Uncharacterized protein n=1 Tax=Piscinibacter gummiphilus TaxID=946333 RepID=A0A1W6L7E1_9BURK|nr:amino acid ABC transporter substrate-binding protein [Piscinibacter gummiphilus]ARN20251.1 hypothetical protein A4W93_10250 [Piscinibacter gummiphilus]ATU64922.1 amino acid ABC transporter substrate-binding protein [Piscinibacter gummiphilus]GLS96445.1 amino acid ABC transporter substrate-binding protein [Piscinibacter gummiphilus]
MEHALLLPKAVFAAIFGVLVMAGPAAAAGTLDKVREAGRLTIGYDDDARPVSYNEAPGKPAGYAIAVCNRVAEAVRTELKVPGLTVQFVALPRGEAFAALEQGRVDLLCGAVPTLERRAKVDFSVPILLSGTSVAVSSNAPVRLVQALNNRVVNEPNWRGSLNQAPQRVNLGVAGSTTLEKALRDGLQERRIVANVVTVKDAAEGVQKLADGQLHAYFDDRSLLTNAVGRRDRPGDFAVLDRLFRRDLVALGVRRQDDDFRLLVDRTLSRLYRSKEFPALYARDMGTPPAGALDFFQLVALPE